MSMLTSQPWQAQAATLGVALLALLLAHRAVRKYTRGRASDDVLATVAMLIGLGWSSEVMWEIAREKIHLSIPVTLMLFFLFEVALLVSMIRAKKHMETRGWTGRPGKSAWGLASFMALVGVAAGESWPERLIRAAAPLVVTKLWHDGVVGDAERPVEVSSWRWTPRRALLAIGAIEPGERDVETVHRERLTQQLVRLEYLRRHGSPKRRARRAARLARLSLKADDAIVAEVRQRVTRATWFTVTPLTQRPDALVTHPDDAPATQVHVAPLRRGKAALTSGDAAASDPKTRAVELVVTQGMSNRKAADAVGLSEATVRRAVADFRDVTHVNGNVPSLEAK